MGIASILSRPQHPIRDSFLPDYLVPAHDLCFQNHDILVELLRAGEEQGVFSCELKFHNDAERAAFQSSSDIFEWFELEPRWHLRNAHRFPESGLINVGSDRLRLQLDGGTVAMNSGLEEIVEFLGE